MSIPLVRTNDDGTQFDITVRHEVDGVLAVKNISTATSKHVILIAPQERVGVRYDADFLTDGTDGILRFILESGQLSGSQILGNWRVQVRLVFPDGAWTSSWATFKVGSALG